VIKWAAFYEHRCKMGAKQIFHLEAFVAKYMRLYERYVKILNVDLEGFTNIAAVTLWASTSIRPSHGECTNMYIRKQLCQITVLYAVIMSGATQVLRSLLSVPAFLGVGDITS
jgi:hypothetical protein